MVISAIAAIHAAGADAQICDRRSESGNRGCREEAAILARVDDAIAETAGEEAAGNASGGEHNPGRDARLRERQPMDPAEERGEEGADRVHIEIEQRAGSDDPPHRGDLENRHHRRSGGQSAMAFGSSAEWFLQVAAAPE